MKNVRRIDWGRPRCVGRARERRRCETVTRHYPGIRDSIRKHVEYLYLRAVRYGGFVRIRYDTLGNCAIFEIDAHLNDPSFHPRSCHDSSNRSLLSLENQNFVNRWHFEPINSWFPEIARYHRRNPIYVISYFAYDVNSFTLLLEIRSRANFTERERERGKKIITPR